ncbi:MAG TPA: zinc ABC transporter substrate-binding protein [Acidimicrobiia bacterium]|nr:zinc ABC transporter substrate-binding protein [Acidimicrobiia bacterium]
MKRLTVGLVLLLVAACGGDDGRAQTAAGSTARIQVVAGFYPLAEAARRVGGERVEVANLTPAGAEPHELELSPRQVDRIADADVVFHLGGGFQPAVEETAERHAARPVDLLRDLPVSRDEADPHVWLDPVLMMSMVGAVEEALAAADPPGRAAYAANASAYRTELEALDDEFRTGLAGCARRVLVTSHAAFGHLAARYGLEQEAIAGLSPEGEPDPRRLSELVDAVRESGTTTVFSETLTSSRIAETLAREAGVATAVLNPLEGLTDEEIGRGETYASVMRQNLAALRSALGCPG